MYIKTRDVRINPEKLEAYLAEGDSVVTFHLSSGTDISIDYGSKIARDNALALLDTIVA